MRSSSDSPEIPNGVLVPAGNSGQMSCFRTIRGDRPAEEVNSPFRADALGTVGRQNGLLVEPGQRRTLQIVRHD